MLTINAIITAAVLVAASSTAVAAENGSTTNGGNRGEAVRSTHVLFVDRSASTSDQRAHWRRAIENVLAEVRFGDRVVVYSLDWRTTDRAAAFHAEIPEGGALTATAKARGARARMKAGVLKTVDALFAQPPSPHSRIVDALALIPRPAQCQCRVRITFFSDMLNDLAPLDLERILVTDPVAAARRVMRDIGLEPGSLTGAEVAVVLDDVVEEARVGVNPRGTVRAIYQALVERQLGARLVRFDANETPVERGRGSR
jgi:hypothetical protein